MPAIIISVLGSVFNSSAFQSLIARYTISFAFLAVFAYVLTVVLDLLRDKAMNYIGSVSGCPAYFIHLMGLDVALSLFLGILFWGFFAKQIVSFLRAKAS